MRLVLKGRPDERVVRRLLEKSWRFVDLAIDQLICDRLGAVNMIDAPAQVLFNSSSNHELPKGVVAGTFSFEPKKVG